MWVGAYCKLLLTMSIDLISAAAIGLCGARWSANHADRIVIVQVNNKKSDPGNGNMAIKGLV